MAVRIEYLLFVSVALLLLSILGLNPTSYEAISSTAKKEIEFHNFSLLDIKSNDIGQKLSALKTVKYKDYLELDSIHLSGINGYSIFAKKAIYKDDFIYMHKDVKLLREDNLTFLTENLSYDIKNKKVENSKPFILKFNKSIIKGNNLEVFINSKKIIANNINASIWFVSKKDESSIQE